MKRSEGISRFLIISGLLLVIGLPVMLRFQTSIIHVSMAENRGWNPDILHAEVGKPLELHLTSDDVAHGFAVGQMTMESVDVMPGKITDITITFDRPGTYTFYCTRWCGVNHWRMRGTIEVSGSDAKRETASVPLYVRLKIDLDAPHESAVVPVSRPSASKGQQWSANLGLAQWSNPDFYRSSSPYQTFESLNSGGLSDSQKWDVTSYIWRSNTTPAALANGKQLYSQNCAACHGEKGAGDGVFADDLAAAGALSTQTMSGSQEMRQQTPADFSDSERLLGASPALLQGKILRGGMGTGMPMWGAIFTEDQMWDLVAYLYSFQFDYEQ